MRVETFRVVDSERNLPLRRGENIQAGDDKKYSSWNLFARMDPLVAQKLYKQVLETLTHSTAITPLQPEQAINQWSIASTKLSTSCRSGVEFLPLAVSRIQKSKTATAEETTIYVSYNGGDLESSIDGSYVPYEESEQYLIDLPTCFSFPSNSSVAVRVLTTVQDAVDILVEPVSVEDWELLEANALWLESGGLLQQVCLVYPNQIIPLWVCSKDVAYVKVLPSNFESESSDEEALWPDDNEECLIDGKMKDSCLRLVTDTQVIVVPKPRNMKSKENPMLRPIPCQDDFPNMKEIEKLQSLLSVKAKVLAVPPCTAAIHPNTIKNVPGFSESTRNMTLLAEIRLVNAMSDSSWNNAEQDDYAVVQLLIYSEVAEDHIAIHPLVRLKLGVRLYMNHVNIKILQPFEMRDRSMLIPRLLQNGQVSLRLDPVNTEIIIEKPHEPWRFPETYSTDHEYGCHDSTVDVTNLAALFSSGVPASIANLPLQIGSFVTQPFIRNGEKCTKLWKLSLDYGAEYLPEHQSPSVQNGFLFVADALKNSSGLLVGQECSTATTSILRIRQPTIISKPLSAFFTVTPSLSTLIMKALPMTNILVYGEKGSGKTTVAKLVAFCQQLSSNCGLVYMDCKKLKVGRAVRMETLLAQLALTFEEAAKAAPSVIILDDLDELTPSYDETSISDDSAQVQQRNPVAIDQAKLVTDLVRQYLRKISMPCQYDKNVVSIVTCHTEASLPQTLLLDGFCESKIKVPQLKVEDRQKLFSKMLSAKIGCKQKTNVASAVFGVQSEGYRPRDIAQFVSRLQIRLLSQGQVTEDLQGTVSEVVKRFVPLARIGVAAKHKESNISWSEIGGLFAAKADLSSTVLQPSKYRYIYANAEIRLPRGILLFGAPGLGKSFCVPALARECGFNLVVCRGPELLDKYIGASEAKVRDLFARAISAAPSIIFLDELDSLAPRRGTDHTGVTDRVVNQLLTFLDGVEDTSKQGSLYIIGATSRPDKVDPALLRPGRLEKHVYFGYPESSDEWTDLVAKISVGFALDCDLSEEIKSGKFIQKLREDQSMHPLLSAADVKSIFNSARLAAIHEALAKKALKDIVPIQGKHLKNAFSSARPSLADSDCNQLQALYSKYRKTKFQVASKPDPKSTVQVEPMRVALR